MLQQLKRLFLADMQLVSSQNYKYSQQLRLSIYSSDSCLRLTVLIAKVCSSEYSIEEQ